MAKKLTDTQLIILSTASQRDDGAVLPLPEGSKLSGGALTKCLNGLLAKGFIEEVDRTPDWQNRDTAEPKILKITDAGLAALGIHEPPQPKTVKSPNPAAPKPGNKTDAIIKLMRRKQGATVEAMQGVTGWLPHSVRAALTGLRKKGIGVARDKNTKGETIYRIAA